MPSVSSSLYREEVKEQREEDGEEEEEEEEEEDEEEGLFTSGVFVFHDCDLTIRLNFYFALAEEKGDGKHIQQINTCSH